MKISCGPHTVDVFLNCMWFRLYVKKTHQEKDDLFYSLSLLSDEAVMNQL